MSGTVLMSGASGLIGSALAAALEHGGWKVRRLVRREPRTLDEVAWDPVGTSLGPAALAGVDVVVHLAGENIGRRWTAARRVRIRQSRVAGTGLLARAIAAADARPRLMISASAVGVYGNRGDAELDESSAMGTGFLADVCRDWEATAEPARSAGVRVVHPRLGVVLTTRGGALPRMMVPFRFGLGGRLGPGDQWMSWIALEDAVRALMMFMTNDLIAGPVNVVSPNPVTNAELTRAIARAVHLRAFFAVPAPILRLALGQMADEALLASQRVRPRRLLELGMGYGCPTVESVLRVAN